MSEEQKKKKRLSDFDFNYTGAAVALVGDFQGGPANGYTVLVTKATNDISEEEINKALNEIPSEGTVPSPDVNVLVVEKDNKSPLNENENKSSQGENMDSVEVQKALDSAKQENEVLKARLDATEQLLKALEADKEARELEGFKAEAVEAGVAADQVEGIAKSWQAMSKVDAEAVKLIIKAMKDKQALFVKSDLFVEKGHTEISDVEKAAKERAASIREAEMKKALKLD